MASARKYPTTSVKPADSGFNGVPRARRSPRDIQTGEAGFSLLEVTVVVLILGIMAVAIVPNFTATEPVKLDLATQMTADTMRFARSEAIRRGIPIGFSHHNGARRWRVFRVDTGTTPWSAVFDVYHPLSKQIYDLRLDQHTAARADTISTSGNFRGSCNSTGQLYFDDAGTARCLDPQTILVNSYQLTLTLGSHSRMVLLDGISGQVTVQ